MLFRLTGNLSGEEKDYCRLRDRLWFEYKRKRSSAQFFSESEIFGRPMRFIRFEDFMRLLDEIFGRRIYAFKTSNLRPLILDLGANIGMSILFFKELYPESRIIAFEPDPRIFQVLSHNVKTNGWKDVELHNAAVVEREGEVDFYTSAKGDFSLESSVYGQRIPGAVKHRVKASRLSSFSRNAIDFLKMDIEGSERAVLEELAGSGALPKIKAMAVEYHHHLIPEEDKLASFLKIFEDHGFSYKLSAPFEHPDASEHFQDILVHAWQKQVKL